MVTDQLVEAALVGLQCVDEVLEWVVLVVLRMFDGLQNEHAMFECDGQVSQFEVRVELTVRVVDAGIASRSLASSTFGPSGSWPSAVSHSRKRLSARLIPFVDDMHRGVESEEWPTRPRSSRTAVAFDRGHTRIQIRAFTVQVGLVELFEECFEPGDGL